jgi:hypothetical protein
MVDEGVKVVQAGVQLMNYTSRWYSTLNVLEYFFWFKSRLHYHAKYGATNHFVYFYYTGLDLRNRLVRFRRVVVGAELGDVLMRRARLRVPLIDHEPVVDIEAQGHLPVLGDQRRRNPRFRGRGAGHRRMGRPPPRHVHRRRADDGGRPHGRRVLRAVRPVAQFAEEKL